LAFLLLKNYPNIHCIQIYNNILTSTCNCG